MLPWRKKPLRHSQLFFMESLLEEFRENFPDIPLYLRGDSGSAMTVNANRLQVHVLAYNLFNWFRRLALQKRVLRNTHEYSEVTSATMLMATDAL